MTRIIRIHELGTVDLDGSNKHLNAMIAKCEGWAHDGDWSRDIESALLLLKKMRGALRASESGWSVTVADARHPVPRIRTIMQRSPSRAIAEAFLEWCALSPQQRGEVGK